MTITVVVRMAEDPSGLATALSKSIRGIDQPQPVYAIEP